VAKFGFPFVPCSYFFFTTIYTNHLATSTDYCIGIILGIALNIGGILKLTDWMANKETAYIFGNRNLLSKDRKGKV